MRWVSLGLLFLLALTDWLSARRKYANLDFVRRRIGLYLALWALTVVASDHQAFSGLRFAAHVAVLVPMMLLVPERMNAIDFRRVMNVIMVICFVVLAVSLLLGSPQPTASPHGWYRGIVGNPNAFGHFSAVGLVLFAHAAFSTKRRGKRNMFVALALLALILLLQSYARSSTVAAFAGLIVLYFFHRAKISKYALVAIVAGGVALITDPTLPEKLADRVFKHDSAQTSLGTADRLLASRTPIFERSIEGFQQRPLFGWGFGVDADTNLSAWSVQFTSTGFTGRDPVNDILYTLETGGIIGFVAYLMLLALLSWVWRQRHLAKVLSAGLSPPSVTPRNYIGFFSLTITLAVLFQFDNTALAAGNFFGVLFWLSFGCSLALAMHVRTEALQLELLSSSRTRRSLQSLTK